MAINEQKATKIRAALAQLDPAENQHWTDDGLPREGIVRKLAGDNTISRRDISEAHPGFQRNPTQPPASATATETQPENVDPLSGEPVQAAQPQAEDALGDDPSKNEGELMSEDEVRQVLEDRVKVATQALADAQQAVRDANKGVVTAQANLQKAREDLTREFPPLSQAANIKQYIASEMAQRAAMHGHGGLAPGSQIDAAMQRGNSRGWRRPTRVGQTQTGAAKVA